MNKLAFLAVMIASSIVFAQPVKLLVDFEDDASVEDVRDSEEETGLNLEPTSFMFPATKLTEVYVDAAEAPALIEQLESDWDIEGVEVSQTYSVMGGADFRVPNDPQYGKQRWHMDMIGLERAWKHATGKGVIVAVLDTGVSDGSSAEFPRVGDLAKASFLPGYNFVGRNERPYDGHGHGTHCASSVLEATNNGIGGVGAAFEAKLMPVKVLSDSGSGATEGIAEGIRFAVDHGAHIISMSLGGGGRSAILEKAVKYAADRNVLVFCAAGNSATDDTHYPAGYDGCLAISAVGPGGQIGSADAGNPKTAKLASYSSYGKAGGKKGIFVAGPGGDKRAFGVEGGVWQSTIKDGNPKEWAVISQNGTSMATPLVSGSAALVVSAVMERDGGRFKASEVKSILEKTATSKGDKYRFGAGIVNAGAAVEAVNKTNFLPWVAGGAVGALGIGFAIFRRRRG